MIFFLPMCAAHIMKNTAWTYPLRWVPDLWTLIELFHYWNNSLTHMLKMTAITCVCSRACQGSCFFFFFTGHIKAVFRAKKTNSARPIQTICVIINARSDASINTRLLMSTSYHTAYFTTSNIILNNLNKNMSDCCTENTIRTNCKSNFKVTCLEVIVGTQLIYIFMDYNTLCFTIKYLKN